MTKEYNYNSVELYILKLFLNREHYSRYSSFVKSEFLNSEAPVLGRLFSLLGSLHSEHPEQQSSFSVTDLQVFYLSQYPASSKTDQELLQKLCENLEELEVNPTLAEDYVRSHIERVKATNLASLGLKVSEGRESFEALQKLALELTTDKNEITDSFVSDDLNKLLDEQTSTKGLRWRLKTLNESLGSLRKGDFGFVFKRPETGGTTFIASEITFMAPQAEGPILWFNNEEQGSKVKLRCFEAHFGLSLSDLRKNRQKYQEAYEQALGGKIKIYDSAYVHKKEVERICFKEKPSLIIFDQIDKVKGFANDRDDLELKQIYQWARELAKNYGAVIGVCQASVSAEGKKYLTMDDVDRSKTAKQGEADWILGIGKTHQQGMEDVRHFHICKNKLVGDEDTNPTLRHAKMDVLIYPEIARYKDI